LESQADKSVFDSAGETVEFVEIHQFGGDNTGSQTFIYFVANMGEKEIRVYIRPFFADLDIKEWLEIFDEQRARFTGLVHAKHLDDEFVLGSMMGNRATVATGTLFGVVTTLTSIESRLHRVLVVDVKIKKTKRFFYDNTILFQNGHGWFVNLLFFLFIE